MSNGIELPGGQPVVQDGGVRRVLIVSGSVGAGHDAAARELRDRLARTGVAVEVRDFLDAVPAWAAWVLREGYLATSRHAPAAFEAMFQGAERQGMSLRAFLGLVHLGRAAVGRWLDAGRHHVVVSTYPVSSQCLGEMREHGRCPVPVLTYVPDPAVHRAWVHRRVDAHLTVTQASADQGFRDHGIPMIAAGPLVPARFATATAGRREELRRELSLPDGLPVALLSAGSLGMGDVQKAAVDLAAAGCVPLVLCGRNSRLVRQLLCVPGAVPLGWRTDVHDLMRVADVLVNNGGGMTINEALVSRLPAVTYRPIPGHGRANAAALDVSGLAAWARSPGDLVTQLEKQLHAAAPASPPGDPTDVVLGVLAGALPA
jgi:processive 1,2-diacylglycerol beta-glucosyltransferase